MPLSRPLRGYVALVGAGGLFTVALSSGAWLPRMLQGVRPVFWVFAIFLLLTEAVQIPRRNQNDESNISTTFAFALLIVFGTAAAVTTQAIATVVVDGFQRKPWWKICFNVGQLALTLACAGLIFGWAPGLPTGQTMRFTHADLPWMVAAAAVFFVVNVTLNGVALAMAERKPLLRYLVDDIVSEAPAMGALLLMAPMLVGMGEYGLFLTPLVAVPLVGVWMQGRLSVRTVHQALHDPLTGLPNRAFLLRELQEAGRRAADVRVALILLDLDRFRDINDTLGHPSGDRVLVEVAHRLANACGETMLLAHLGGDDFGILLRESGTDLVSAKSTADELLEVLDAPIDLEGLPLYVAASAGVALSPEHGGPVELPRFADVALSATKDAGARCKVYEGSLSMHTPMQLVMVGELRRALMSEAELLLHYQPKIDITTGDLLGAEALVRWDHSTLGLIYPDAFVPLAERTGQITQLTSWVLNSAVRACAGWRAADVDAGVAVNISPRELVDPSLVERVLEILAEHRLPASSLVLEITENALVHDPPSAIVLLQELRSHGVRVSLDDFGSGYSSLAYLKDLPITEVKIDKTFVINMGAEARDEMVVRSIVELGHNLGVTVVAEGVDDQDTLDRLASMRCDLAQGYFIARPMDAARLERWVAMRAGAADVPMGKVLRMAEASSLRSDSGRSS